MATANGPNLEPARIQIEKLMDDTCLVTRDRLGDLDAALDVNTGLLTRPPAEIIYDETTLGNPTTAEPLGRALGGKCKITSLRDSQPTTLVSPDRHQDPRFYRFSVPIDAPALEVGDLITITSARRWQNMVGHTYWIRETKDTSLAFQQSVVAERRVDLPVVDASAPRPTVPAVNATGPLATKTAAATLAAGTVVRLNSSDRVVAFDPTNTALYGEAFGITVEAVVNGGVVRVATGGTVAIAAWSLTPGAPYWAYAGGDITSTPPASGLLTLVGVAVSTTELYVRFGTDVVL